jgi:hypothetical protein
MSQASSCDHIKSKKEKRSVFDSIAHLPNDKGASFLIASVITTRLRGKSKHNSSTPRIKNIKSESPVQPPRL